MTQNISQGERIHSIDIIRGIAVLGIFLVNWPIIAGIDSRIFQEFTRGQIAISVYFTICSFKQSFILSFHFIRPRLLHFMTRAEAKQIDQKLYLFVVYLFYYYSVSYITFFYGTETFYIVMQSLDFSYFYFIRENLVLF